MPKNIYYFINFLIGFQDYFTYFELIKSVSQ